MMKAGEIEAVLEKSQSLTWWQYLFVFILVQLLVYFIFKQSSKMMRSGNNSGNGKLRPTLSRLLSIPSMAYEQFNSPSPRTWSFSPIRSWNE